MLRSPSVEFIRRLLKEENVNIPIWIRAVIADVDNTLLASDVFCRETILETLVAMFGDTHPQPSEEEFRAVFRRNLPFEKIFDTLFPENWQEVLTQYRQRAVNKPYKATPHAVEIMRSLHARGCLIGLVTNRENLLRERLTQVGFDVSCFAFIYQPTDERTRKPHPGSLNRAMDHLTEKGIARNEILFIGDHTDDLQAARAHNVDFVAVLQGGATQADFLREGLDTFSMCAHLGTLEQTLTRRAHAHALRQSLAHVSALDGRHANIATELSEYFSEYALHKWRVLVEIEHLIQLGTTGIFPFPLKKTCVDDLQQIARSFTHEDAFAIAQYDHLGRHGIGPTEHDVKSCELWIRERLTEMSMEWLMPYVHLYLTSEDVNNLAYKLMFASAINHVIVPHIACLYHDLHRLAHQHARNPVLARTHVQPASPTTFGKIFAVYADRLAESVEHLSQLSLTGKLNGATGNYHTFIVGQPHVDWPLYAKQLMSHLGLAHAPLTDQRGTHADMIRVLHWLQEVNNVVRDFATDLSLYAGFGTMYFTKVESHVGSSTMPHKVNPWFAEVAESNAKKSNALINVMANELDVSRLQRDLSDHDFERSYGEAFGYALVALKHVQIALNLIRPDTEAALNELGQHPEVVTEAIQTLLRLAGRNDAYDVLKQRFRGVHPSFNDLREFVQTLSDLNEDDRNRLLNLIFPGAYIGLAGELTNHIRPFPNGPFLRHI